MNKVILMGRLTRDPEVRYAGDGGKTVIAKYTMAVDRRFKKDGENSADFINITAFGKLGEFAEKYLKKGMKILVTGRIQTGSYTNKDGQKVYTQDVMAEETEFCESKNSGNNSKQDESTQSGPISDGFMNIPDGIEDELPFS